MNNALPPRSRYAVGAVRPQSNVFTAQWLLSVLGSMGVAVAGVFWWELHMTLFPDQIGAVISWTIIRTLAPPTLLSFIIPRTAGAQLLSQIRWGTIGQVVAAVTTGYLLWDSWLLQYGYWASQTTLRYTTARDQAIVGMLGFVIIPALTVASATSGEIVEMIRSAHLVRRAELMMQADVQITRTVLLRATQMAQRGYGNLSPQEQEHFRGVLGWLIASMDTTLHSIVESIDVATGVKGTATPIRIADNPVVQDGMGRFEYDCTHGSLEGYGAEPAKPDAVGTPLDDGMYRFMEEDDHGTV